MKQSAAFRVVPPAQPILLIDRETLERARYLVAKAPKECQWWFRVRRFEGKAYVAYELFDLLVPEQWTSGADVESDPEMMIKLWKDLREERGLSLEELSAIMNDASCWCHSHVNMACRPSGTDNKQWAEQKKLAFDGGSTHPQLMMIFNKNDEFFCRVWDPALNLEFENVPLNIQDNIDTDEIDSIVKTKLKTRPKVTKTAARHWSQGPKGSTHHNSSRDWRESWWWQQTGSDDWDEEEAQPGWGQSGTKKASEQEIDPGTIREYTSMDDDEFDELCKLVVIIDGNDSDETKRLEAAKRIYEIIEPLIDEEDIYVLNTLLFGTIKEVMDLPQQVTVIARRNKEQVNQDIFTLIGNLSELPMNIPTMLPEAVETTIDITCTGDYHIAKAFAEKWVKWYGDELPIIRGEGKQSTSS